MKKPPPPTSTSEEQVRTLLVRYACPVPFHEVRTRFLGSIASPGVDISPMKLVQELWGGELPEFESLDAANELIGALVMGLWNGLSRHQERSAPFRLLRHAIEPTREELAALGLMRMQELDGFFHGLFGADEEAEVPERASRGLDSLSKMRTMFALVVDAAGDKTKPGTIKNMETTLRLLRAITKNAEHEIHAIVLACERSRRQMLAGFMVKKPTIH